MFDAYRQRPLEQADLISSLAIAVAKHKLKHDPKVADFFRSQGYLENYTEMIRKLAESQEQRDDKRKNDREP